MSCTRLTPPARPCGSRAPHKSPADPSAERSTDSSSSGTPLCVITNRPLPSAANGVTAAAPLSTPGTDASVGAKGSRRWVRAAVPAGCPRGGGTGVGARPVCGSGAVPGSRACGCPREVRGGALGCAELRVGARPGWGCAPPRSAPTALAGPGPASRRALGTEDQGPSWLSVIHGHVSGAERSLSRSKGLELAERANARKGKLAAWCRGSRAVPGLPGTWPSAVPGAAPSPDGQC